MAFTITECEHRGQWEWVGGVDPIARRLRCNRCNQILPCGESPDPTADRDVDMHWETIAIDVAAAIRDGATVEVIQRALTTLGATPPEIVAFWLGMRDSACGENCLTVATVAQAMSEVDGHRGIDLPNGTVIYAAGSLAQSLAGDCGNPCASGKARLLAAS